MIKEILNKVKELWVLLGVFMILNLCVILFYELMIWYSSLFGCSDKENVEFAEYILRTLLVVSLYYNIKLKFKE